MPFRPFLRLAAAFALAFAATASTAASNADLKTTPATEDRSPPSWSDCGDGFECAYVEVPLDYARPYAGRIEIALTRKPAFDAQHRIGSLFVHPGGAGLGATFLRIYPTAFFEAFARFDVIGFDVRGLGRSRPAFVACGSNPAARKPYPRPANTDERALVGAVRDYVELCQARNRDLLPHLSTANIARDLDRLRAAVGDRDLNYLGQSFGSIIGANYATLFPGRARAMLLDSPLDVQDYYERPLLDIWERAQGHEQALTRFLAACKNAGLRCAFGDGDPQAAFARLQAQLDREPLPSPDPADARRLAGDDLRDVLTFVIADSRYWSELASGLKQADDGDPRALLAYFEGGDDPAALAAQSFYEAMTSVDQRWPRTPLWRYFDNAARAYQSLPHLFFATGYTDLVHALWPARDAAALRGPIRNPFWAEPILLVASTHDAAAPYTQAQSLLRDLGNARLLTRDADGHGAIMNPCVLDYAVRYFDAGALPPRGTVCAQNDDPFATGASANLPALTPSALRSLR